jgi:uncharacterized protein
VSATADTTEAMPRHALLRKCLAMLAAAFVATGAAAAPKKILVVTTTLGYRHSSIETAEKVIAELGRSSGLYEVEFASVAPPKPPGANASETQQAAQRAEQAAYEEKVGAVLAAKLNPAALKRYDGVVFASTVGELPLPDKDAFIRWIKDGGAFVGIHSASDTLHGYPPYREMLGGEFEVHHEQVVIEGINVDAAHPANRHLGATWNLQGKKEEIYLFKNYLQPSVHELIVLDRHPNTRAPGHFPIAWCREFGAGRVFYTALGHNEHLWEMPEFQQHVLGGIGWALRLSARQPAALEPSR